MDDNFGLGYAMGQDSGNNGGFGGNDGHLFGGFHITLPFAK